MSRTSQRPLPRIPLGDVLEDIVAGKSPKALKRPAVGAELGVLKVSSVSSGQFRPGENKALPSGFDASEIATVGKGDLIISRANTTELVGAVAIAEEDFSNLLLSDKTLRLDVDPRQAEPRFLLYAMRTRPVRYQLESRATGTSGSMRNISQATLRGIRVPLPPLDEQRRIAAILDKANAIRRKRREAIAMTEELLRATFLELFGDPVTNAKGWRTVPLHTVAEVNSGITKNRRLAPEDAEEVPYMRVANVQDGYLDLDEIKTIPVAKDKVERYLLHVGDVLLTEGGDPDKLGRGAVWRGQIERCVHQNHIFSVRVNRDHLIPAFASAVIGSDRGKRYFLKAGKQTTGIASINKTQLKNFEILLPPLSAQLAYESAVNRVRTLEDRLSKVTAATDDLFESLVQRAFRGDL